MSFQQDMNAILESYASFKIAEPHVTESDLQTLEWLAAHNPKFDATIILLVKEIRRLQRAL